MGRVRTYTVKRSGHKIIESYYNRLNCDFENNKRITSSVASVPSKRLRNKIAGYITHTMKRLKKRSVRGISFTINQRETELAHDNIDEEDSLTSDAVIEVDSYAAAMLNSLNVGFDYTTSNAESNSREKGRDVRKN